MKNCLSTVACFVLLGSLSCFPITMAQDLSDGFTDRERQDAMTATVPRSFQRQTDNNAPQGGYLPPSQRPLAGNHQLPYGIAATLETRSIGTAWPAMSREVAESNAAVNDLIQKLRTAEQDEEKDDIKTKLKTELEHQYDLYLDQHEAPLKQLEEKLAKLRKEFDWRKSARDDLVKLRLDTIWYNSQGLGWPGQNSNYFIGPSSFPNATPFPNASGFQNRAPSLNSPIPPRAPNRRTRSIAEEDSTR